MSNIATPFNYSWRLDRPSVYAGLGIFFILASLVPTFITIFANENKLVWTSIVYICAVVLVAYVLAMVNVKAAILCLLLVLPWQPFLSMPFAEQLGSTSIRALVSTKDVYVAVLLGALFLKHSQSVRLTKADLAAVLFVAVYCFYLFITPVGLLGAAVSFREGFMIIAFYLVGRLSKFTWSEVQWFVKVVIVTAIIILLFGYIEYTTWSEIDWTNWGAGEYVEAKSGPFVSRYEIAGHLPINWHTRISGNLYRRMVSGIGDPTSLSRYLSLPLLCLLFIPYALPSVKRISLLWLLIVLSFCVGMILTFGRGGWLIVVCGIAVWLLFLNRLFVLLAIALILAVLSSPIINSAYAGHVPSALAGFQQMINQPIGQGLGTAGQLALYYSDNALEATGESYLAALGFQTGLLGVLGYSYFIFSLAKQLWFISMKSRTNGLAFYFPYARLALALILGIFATSLFANSAVAPISAGASLMYCGMILTAWHQLLLQSANLEVDVLENVGTS